MFCVGSARNEVFERKICKNLDYKDNIVYSWQNRKMMTTTNDYISILRKYLSTKADAYGITNLDKISEL